jgi:hypothetical protein
MFAMTEWESTRELMAATAGFSHDVADLEAEVGRRSHPMLMLSISPTGS